MDNVPLDMTNQPLPRTSSSDATFEFQYGADSDAEVRGPLCKRHMEDFCDGMRTVEYKLNEQDWRRTNSNENVLWATKETNILSIPMEIRFESNGRVTGGGNKLTSSRTMIPLAPLDGGAYSFEAWLNCANPTELNQVRVFDLGFAS